jgi:hypothetical protein
MNIEEYQDNNIGKHYIYIKNSKNEIFIPMSYHDHAIRAFYFNCQDLEKFENTKNISANGNHAILCVSFWYLAIESFISTILKAYCFIKNDSYSLYKGKSIDSRISEICKYLKMDTKIFYQTDVYSKLREFECFRNEVFHDRTIEDKLIFTKTIFSGIPYLANIADSVQAMIIAVEVFSYFKNVIPGLNLMPNICIQKNDSFYFEKVDYLYNELIIKLYKKILEKHSIDTLLDLKLNIFECTNKIAIGNNSVGVLVKSGQDNKYNSIPNIEKTNYSTEYFNEIKQKLSYDSNHTFKIANYMDKSNI